MKTSSSAESSLSTYVMANLKPVYSVFAFWILLPFADVFLIEAEVSQILITFLGGAIYSGIAGIVISFGACIACFFARYSSEIKDYEKWTISFTLYIFLLPIGILFNSGPENILFLLLCLIILITGSMFGGWLGEKIGKLETNQ